MQWAYFWNERAVCSRPPPPGPKHHCCFTDPAHHHENNNKIKIKTIKNNTLGVIQNKGSIHEYTVNIERLVRAVASDADWWRHCGYFRSSCVLTTINGRLLSLTPRTWSFSFIKLKFAAKNFIVTNVTSWIIPITNEQHSQLSLKSARWETNVTKFLPVL